MGIFICGRMQNSFYKLKELAAMQKQRRSAMVASLPSRLKTLKYNALYEILSKQYNGLGTAFASKISPPIGENLLKLVLPVA